MADKKISALTGATTPLAGTEVLPIVQGGSTVKVSVDNLTAGKNVSAAKLSVNTTSTASKVIVGRSGAGHGIDHGVLFVDQANNNLAVVSIEGYSTNDLQLLSGSGIRLYTNSNLANSGLVAQVDTSGNITANTGNVVIGTAGKGITTGSAIPLGFGVNNSVTAITIDTASNLGVGTTSPATRLHAQSSASNTTFRATSELSGSFYYSGFEVNRSGTAGGALMRASRDAAQGGVGWEWLVTADNAAEVSGTYTNGMTLDTLGNLKVANSISVGTTGTIFSEPYTVPGNIQTWLVNNGSINDTYIASDTAQRFRVLSGVGYQWQLAGAGTAGSAVSYTTAMTLDLSGNLGIGTSPAATAILDVQSTTKGVRFPNMTTTEKNAITPSAGTVVFDTTLSKLCVYSGAAWQTITSV